jgi:hypothetical protein
LAGYAPVMGVYGVGFLLAVSAALWVEAFQDNRFRLQAVVSLTLIWVTGWGLQYVQ